MKVSFKKMSEWVDGRNTKERVLLLAIGFVLIYLLWNIVFTQDLIAQQKELAQKIKILKEQIATMQKQSNAMLAVISDTSFYHALNQEKNLNNAAKDLQSRIKSLAPIFINDESMQQFDNEILVKQPGIELGSIHNVSTEHWSPAADIDLSKLSLENKDIYKRVVEVNFKSTYFDTMRYLTHLENLSWRLYWDSLEYRVSQYPNADVTIKFYVFTHHKSAS